MTSTSDLTAMYKAHAGYVWVEDEETRTYLATVWREPRLGLYVGGGHGSVNAAVKGAHEHGYKHVFGIRDRDFTPGNRSKWTNDDVIVLATEAFELENLLLDAAAIADCEVNDSGKSTADIGFELHRLATPLAWWMACRKTMTSIAESLVQEFPEHPTRANVTRRDHAIASILESVWWKQTLPTIAQWDSARVENALDTHHASYAAMLSNDAWRWDFSGKEVLGERLTLVWQKGRPAGRQSKLDFIKAIGDAQLKLDRVPNEVTELLVAVRARVGL